MTTRVSLEMEPSATKTFWKEGFRAAWPISIGYFPLGLAFGVLAQKAGLDVLHIGLMSVLVFAGSAQFIAVSMLSMGAETASIVLTTFVVNLRHVLMSSSTAVYLVGLNRGFLALFAYGVTDESFAVNIMRFRGGKWHPKQALVVNQVSNAAWVGSTVLGGMAGQFLPAGGFGMDYALIAMFLALLVFQLRGRIYVITALLSGVTALGLSLVLPGNAYVVLASLLGATLGYALRRGMKRRGVHV